jgi:TRAP-type C4-dicarboxylate transport system substrate-binding protein
MDIHSEKLEIIKMLIATDDSSVIVALKDILELHKKAVWNELSPEQQEIIDLQILEENRGDQLEV